MQSSTIPLKTHLHPTKGRALYATQSFQPGQVVHAFTPLILVPSVSHLASVCSHCLRPGSPRACSRCRAAYYCGSACQAAAWSAVHSRECKALRERLPDEGRRRALPTVVRALLQALLWKRIAEHLEPLEDHLGERMKAEDESENLMTAAMGACEFSGKGTGDEDLLKATRLLCKIQTNSFQRFDDGLGVIGLFIEPILAMANHSCMPNAMIQFSGRKAVMRAESPIKAGDEVQISYTFNTDPLPKRREALSHFKFVCRCPLCEDNLNVYQACAISPNISLNSLSLVTDLSRLREHPAASSSKKMSSANRYCKVVDYQGDSLSTVQPLPERRKLLQREYSACAGLVQEELWAVAPLPEILIAISNYYAGKANFLFALTTGCFVATACDPYQYTVPFDPIRLGTMFRLATYLSQTAPTTASLTNSVKSVTAKATLDQKIQETLQEIDQASLCQMLLIMILRWTPDDYKEDWGVSARAQDLLSDIEQLRGREQELSLIDKWRRDPASDHSRAFFDYAVVQPVNALAAFGRAVLKLDFESGPERSG